ncbi:RHOMBOID-like protein 3 [Vitis vinifera]|uniref:RHOMBOID-like protein n=1 Tax=Vitis vinifera TaxID=29760 RepID=A0A438JJF8_VITVI|nr:RHOMBOID-like protein 3 [Vitis vinifera]
MANEDLERGGGMKNRGNNGHPPGYYSSTYYAEASETHWTSWLIPMFVVANVAVLWWSCMSMTALRRIPGSRGLVLLSFFGGSRFSLSGRTLSLAPRLLRELKLLDIQSKPSKLNRRLHFLPFLALSLLKFDKNDLYLENHESHHQTFCWAVVIGNPVGAQKLEKLGGLEWNKVVYGDQGWRLVTCIWLHAGVIHLLANMLSLVFIGIRLEQQFGFVRIGIIYLVSGFGGSILSSLFIQHNISVGASGALFGLLGAMLSELITNWSIYTNKAAALFTLVVIIAINLAVGILPHVDNFAHIGGFLTGFLLGFMLLLRPQFGWVKRQHRPADARVKSKHKVYQYAFWLVAMALLIVGFTVGLVMLFRGENGNDHCSWCHYLSCVPTSKWKCDN